MFIRQHRGQYWAVHFSGSGCGSTHAISRESDEHRRQKDYWQRAAQDAGHPAAQEFRTTSNTILDVAIMGRRHTGIEVQHSALPQRAVKSRTTRSFRAGWLPIWFLDSDRTPPWFHDVPALGCNRLPWSSLPPRRSATAIGLSRFVAKPCSVVNFNRCPAAARKRSRRFCGQDHPTREALGGYTVDDVAGLIPAEKIVPMRDLHGYVRLVKPRDLAFFQGLTGLSGAYEPGSARTAARVATTSAECANPAHDHELAAVTRCSKCDQASAGFGDVLCPACLALLSQPAHWYRD
jgi:hypothetical protein